MKTTRANASLLLAAALLAAVGMIAGCHSAAKTPPEAAPTPAADKAAPPPAAEKGAPAAPADKAAPAPAAEKGAAVPAATKAATGPAKSGSQLWAERCSKCHNLRDPGSLSSAQWQVAVAHMRLRVPLTGEEEREISKFLSAK